MGTRLIASWVFIPWSLALLAVGCTSPAPAPSAPPQAPAQPASTPVAVAPAPSPTPPKPPPSSKFTLHEEVLQFAPGQAQLPPVGIEEVRKVAKQLESLHEPFTLVVTGYSSSDGSHARNLDLSRHRAEAVAKALEDAGIPKTQIQVQGLGSEHPVSDNATPEGRAKNRRVEIEVQTSDRSTH